MTKKYNTPMLQVVSIKKNDIVTSSPIVSMSADTQDNDEALSAGRRFNEWYEGY